MAELPQEITQVPGPFKPLAEAINALIALQKPWTNVEGKGGINVTVSDSNAVISAEELLGQIQEQAEILFHPFYPFPVPGSAAVTFEPGIIISGGVSISPTVGGGSTMATVPRPQLTITTSGTIYLEATVDGAGNATAIDTKNAATTPASTTTLKRVRIADVTLSGTVVTVTARYFRETRTLYLCNGSPIWEA